ncbi:LysR family transcriptional regulator [Cupriavidus taiwanensis]|uniref:Putative LysR family transcriptional regulator n=1 Tax=Cupriavidus taiwanensis TaxID=164546 RepID=A0A375IMN8_9BURK|nr:LysR family transcriptional regulator [Cupriavidus taiwanensis]SOY70344.1 putative LysR family transcriptional regulator [Cupriavidus taiwanensis]SOY70756.1 putative LysR family transcriptional regulator [Cupriavidus taiwanensis]SOY95585.1 putative LysR family transcriptional regulator [Cupriavidus taiwanensis]SOZ29787.1 putative LysR family transcriptional regulator [Cupriavidus taiwanensis]SOZ74632.1 putative LysR family transcriptional regulator [Cupriavidus taiwanensis]
MDLRQLRYFCAVAKHGSISVAAQSVHIAQPALTRQIQSLEDDLGTRLLERTTRGVKLTDAGIQLLEDAGKLLDDASAAKERAQRAGRGESGHLSIALPVMQNLAPKIAEVLKKYRKEVPGVGITLHHLLSDVQLGQIAEGRLDAGFLLFRPPDDPDFEGIPVFSDRMLLAYPADWKWPRGKGPKVLKDLQDLEFIWLPRTAAPAWHDRLIHCFFDAGFIPRTAVHGVDAASMLTLVAAGMGCTILPEGARRIAPETVAFMPLADLTIRQDWELVWRRDRCSSVLQRFISVVSSSRSALRQSS